MTNGYSRSDARKRRDGDRVMQTLHIPVQTHDTPRTVGLPGRTILATISLRGDLTRERGA